MDVTLADMEEIVARAGSDAFGPMMAAVADARGFFHAAKKAFVADGQAYNWTIQRQWFSEPKRRLP